MVPSSGSGLVSPESSLNLGRKSDWDALSRRSPSVGSRFSTCSSSEIIEDSALIHVPSTEENEIGFNSPVFQQNDGDQYHASVASTAIVSTSLSQK